MSQDTPRVTTPMDFQGFSQLKAAAQNPQDPAAVREVAQQFESLFVQMMMKSMRDTVPKDGLLGGDQNGVYQEMQDKQMAMDIARQGGVGLAKMIEAQLQSSAPQPRDDAVLPPKDEQ